MKDDLQREKLDAFFGGLADGMKTRIQREVVWIVLMALAFYVSMVLAVSMGTRLGPYHHEFFIDGQDWYMLAVFLVTAGFVVLPILVLWFIAVRVYDHFFAVKKVGFTWTLFFLAVLAALVGMAFGSFLGGMFF